MTAAGNDTDPDAPRVAPPPRSTLDPATNELLDLAKAPSGETAETIAVMAHSPALVGPFLGWAMALHTNGVLSPRLHEIVALRVAHNCGSTYEWDEHVRWARQAGLTDAEIASIADADPQWSGAEAVVIAAVDELHLNQNLDDDTLGLLTEALGEASVVELILVAGQYTMLSMLASATGSARRPRKA